VKRLFLTPQTTPLSAAPIDTSVIE